jgi:hypothetical protein
MRICGWCGVRLPEDQMIWMGRKGRYGQWQCLSPSVCRWRRQRNFERRQTSFDFGEA